MCLSQRRSIRCDVHRYGLQGEINLCGSVNQLALEAQDEKFRSPRNQIRCNAHRLCYLRPMLVADREAIGHRGEDVSEHRPALNASRSGCPNDLPLHMMQVESRPSAQPISESGAATCLHNPAVATLGLDSV